MKKNISIVAIILFITSCTPKDDGDISSNTAQQVEETGNQHFESQEILEANAAPQIEEAENQHIESQDTKEADPLSWFELTEDGVNEELFLRIWIQKY